MRSNFSRWLEEKYLKWQVEAGSRSTLADFAIYLGISRVSLSQYLHGTRSPNDRHLIKIASRLGNEVYETVEGNNIVFLTTIKRVVRRFAANYWPIILSLIILLALFASSSYCMVFLIKASNQTANLTPAGLGTASGTELGEDLLTTAEAASAQAQATTLAIRNLEEGNCDVLGPGNNLRLCDLNGRDLSGMDLSGADLEGANLTGVNLSGSNMSGANLAGALLMSSTLTTTDFSGTILVGTNLSDSNLAYANLKGANLTGAILRGADLTWVNFSQAILVGADLSDCNLLNAIINIDQISVALSLENALLPKELR